MINSQIPFNKLPLLETRMSEWRLDTDHGMLDAIRVIDYLNGFLEGFDDDLLQFYLSNLQYTEIRHSLELEGYPVAINRIFEAENSENALQDDLLAGIIDYHSRQKLGKQVGLDVLRPASFRSLVKHADQIRERKEQTIKSYFTNLTLYTAPSQTAVLTQLRQNLDVFISDESAFKQLHAVSLVHYQFRAISPFNHLNGLGARTLFLQALQLYGLQASTLPLSAELMRQRERYQTLMRDSIQSGQLEEWHKFMAEVIERACRRLIAQLRQMNKLKKQLVEQIGKYTDYNMPVELALALMQQPYIKVIDLVSELRCHRQTAATYLKHLVKMGILVEKRSGREKLYLNKELMDILSN